MRRWMTMGAALTLALGVTACAGDRSPDADQAAPRTNAGDTAVGTSGTAADEQEFVQEQLAMGEAEIALGQLAQERGTHPEVKRFGEMMVRDHRMAGQELKELMAKTNDRGTGTAAGTEPARNTNAHGDHQEALEELRETSGAEFDKKYIDRMVKDHEEGVRDVERRAENGNNPEIRQWAAKTLPKMQQHLERAKTIQETLEQAGDNNRGNQNNRPKGDR